jgi:hypothetical protein
MTREWRIKIVFDRHTAVALVIHFYIYFMTRIGSAMSHVIARQLFVSGSFDNTVKVRGFLCNIYLTLLTYNNKNTEVRPVL